MAPARILIVEDDELTALLERAVLEAAGFEVEAVPTGEEALARLAIAAFDAMVLDLVLPGLHGDAVLRELAPERLATMPVLIVSGYDDPRRIETLRSLGAADYLVKDSRMSVFELLPRRLRELIARRDA